MNILGLNFFHPNSSASIFVDGKLIAAAEEERFNRVKFSAGIPFAAISYCLQEAGLEFRQIDLITYARSTNTRIVNNDQIHYQDRIYRISSLYDRYRMNLKLINFKEKLAAHFGIPVETLVFKLREEDHHVSHLLSGFLCSPFDQALLLSCDAFGDFVSLKMGVGRGRDIQVVGEVEFPHSVGLFYTMVTQYLGFTEYGDESKVMGLATFGHPEFTDRLRKIISYDNGSVRLNLDYFNAERGVGTAWAGQTPDISRIFSDNLTQFLGAPREPGQPISARDQNLAASTQHLVEEVIFSLIEKLYREFKIPNLVFTGGLAYNSLLNGKIAAQTEIDSVFIPPAPGNSGLAIGSTLSFLGDQAPRWQMRDAALGPSYSSSTVEKELRKRGVPYRKVEDRCATAVELLEKGQTVAWFQGRMEFGPRSLGNRSILIHPRKTDPARIKKRDELKPFGISILQEAAPEYFRDALPSPFMSFMDNIRSRYRPQVENVLLNNYCRYQTVGEGSGHFEKLLRQFSRKSGLPFLVNTSLNPEGQPIVDSPQTLLDGWERLHVDAALVEDLLVENPRA